MVVSALLLYAVLTPNVYRSFDYVESIVRFWEIGHPNTSTLTTEEIITEELELLISPSLILI
jgi:hypothetical protein